MSDSAFSQLVHKLKEKIFECTPKDTGNLAGNATKIEPLSKGAFRIYVNTIGDHSPRSTDGIAPYFVYVNYGKTLRNGRINPNYKYWDDAVESAVNMIAQELGGTVEK